MHERQQRHATALVTDRQRQQSFDLQTVLRILPADQSRLTELPGSNRVVVMGEPLPVDEELRRLRRRLVDVRGAAAVHIRITDHTRDSGRIGPAAPIHIHAIELRRRAVRPFDPELGIAPENRLRGTAVGLRDVAGLAAACGDHVHFLFGEPVVLAVPCREREPLSVGRINRRPVRAAARDQRLQLAGGYVHRINVRAIQVIEARTRPAVECDLRSGRRPLERPDRERFARQRPDVAALYVSDVQMDASPALPHHPRIVLVLRPLLFFRRRLVETRERDRLPVRRPFEFAHRRRRIDELPRLASIGIDQPQRVLPIAVADERDALSIRRPARPEVRATRERELAIVLSIGIDDPQIRVVSALLQVRFREHIRDAFAVRRPARGRRLGKCGVVLNGESGGENQGSEHGLACYPPPP